MMHSTAQVSMGAEGMTAHRAFLEAASADGGALALASGARKFAAGCSSRRQAADIRERR